MFFGFQYLNDWVTYGYVTDASRLDYFILASNIVKWFSVHFSQVRRNVRPLFQTTKGKIFLYDAITFVGTRLLIAYLTFPFVMLEFWAALKIYRYHNIGLYVCIELLLSVTGNLILRSMYLMRNANASSSDM